MTNRFGWLPDKPDYRDKIFEVPASLLISTIPSAVDLRDKCPPVYDQGDLGSCTANAIAGAHQFEQMRQFMDPQFVPSRLFIYYNERKIEGTTTNDAGAFIRDGIKTIAQQGVCPETLWPYKTERYAWEPEAKCYQEAANYTGLKYERVVRGNGNAFVRGALASGFPVIFGFTVFQNFESDEVAKTGIMQMPSGPSIGGHAVLAVGYDDSKEWVICRNSWSASWGDSGYFYMPYSYISNPGLCDDFWILTLIK